MLNKMMTKWLTLAFLTLLFVGVFHIKAEALTSGDYEYRHSNGGIMITNYTGQEKDLILPNEIAGKRVLAIGNSAFHSKNLTSVVIPDSVSTIKESAFSANALTTVVIPENITSIEPYVFYGNELTTVQLPKKLKKITNSAFSNNFITEIELPNTLTELGPFAFEQNKLTDVVIPNSVKNIESGVFSNNELTTATLPNNLTFIPDSLFSYNELTTIDIPNTVTDIGYNSFNSNKLQSIVLPNKLEYIESSAFSNNELTSINIPNKVTHISNRAFSNNKLQAVTLPNSLEYIGEYGFSDNELEEIAIPKATTLSRNALDNNPFSKGISGAAYSSAYDLARYKNYIFNEYQYTITYDGNGQSLGEAPIDDKGYLENAMSIAKDPGNLTKDLYFFKQWNTKQDGTGRAIRVGEALQINKNITLYAQWQVAINLEEISTLSSVIIGQTLPEATIEIFKGATKLTEVTADSQGVFDFTLEAQRAGTELNIVISKDDKKATHKVIVADKTPPTTTVDAIHTNTTKIIGRTKANASVKIKIGNRAYRTVKANNTGKFTLNITKQKVGTKINFIATDQANNKFTLKLTVTEQQTLQLMTAKAAAIVDKTAPAKPIVNAITAKTTKVTGTAEAGSTVSIYKGKTKIGSAKVNAKGIYSVTIKAQKVNTKLTVQAVDAAKNASKLTAITVKK